MGVASAKIEGRMKRPEYVSAAVRACVEQRDFGFISDKTQKMLRGVFSRTGFTDAYYIGKTGSHMFGTRTKSDVVSADEKLFLAIRSSYKDEIGNVEITFDFTAKLGENPVLIASDGVHTVRKIADTVTEKAINRPIDAEKCRKQLEKTGSTAYNPTDVNINIDDDISIPLSIINSLRRDVLAELDTARSIVHSYKINRDYEITFPKFTPSVEKSTRARVPQTKLSDAFKKCELVFVPLFADKRELVRTGRYDCKKAFRDERNRHIRCVVQQSRSIIHCQKSRFHTSFGFRNEFCKYSRPFVGGGIRNQGRRTQF